MASTQQRIIGQSHASFWRPAVTDEELNDPEVLLFNYRQCMARTRVLYLIGGLATLAWIGNFVRGTRRRR